jgi:hypothetical protein
MPSGEGIRKEMGADGRGVAPDCILYTAYYGPAFSVSRKMSRGVGKNVPGGADFSRKMLTPIRIAYNIHHINRDLSSGIGKE